MDVKTNCGKSFTFQSLGLHPMLLKSLSTCKYNRPTPIQRKTIPLILNGNDVVAMARTGSGKTAAFLIPMVQKLLSKNLTESGNVECSLYVLILSPTRELAIQTYMFLKKITKYCKEIRFSLVLGGDSMDEQFELLSRNTPHVLIATPGRMLHLLVEMKVKALRKVELLVLDEADRLFELGFSEQLTELLSRTPAERQTVLFSATLPEQLSLFAKAKLHTPFVVKLDTETKLSNDLTVNYFLNIQEHKLSALCMLILDVIPEDQQVMIFVATKHDVELLGMVLSRYGQKCSCLYGSMDQTARRISLDKFKYNKTRILIVTDIAARGIDIPLLDNVVNFNFPSKPKLFIHRVGRVARNGHLGTAYSLLNYDELPWLFDLHKFIGRDLIYSNKANHDDTVGNNFVLGTIPLPCFEQYLSFVNTLLADELSMENSNAENGMKAYLRFSEPASKQSAERCKVDREQLSSLEPHPILSKYFDMNNTDATKIYSEIKNWRGKRNVFELSMCDSKAASAVMKKKRLKHENVIEQTLNCPDKIKVTSPNVLHMDDSKITVKVSTSNNSSYFIPYERRFNDSEGFTDELNEAVYAVHPDDTDEIRKTRQRMRWDRKKKKFVSVPDVNMKKIRTENKNFISASYKTNSYEKWMEKNKIGLGNKILPHHHTKERSKFGKRHGKNHEPNSKVKMSQRNYQKLNVKSSQQILKVRNRKQKLKNFQAKRAEKRLNNKNKIN